MDVGADYGIRNAGYYALRSLRTEKFFAFWGTDLNSSVTPLECGRDQRVKFTVSSQLYPGPIHRIPTQVHQDHSL